jgi:glycosyltransferase involved in cell wall biosynthesis
MLTTARPKAILFFDHTAKMGGGEIALFQVVTHLDRDRFTPLVLLASEGPLATKLRAEQIETIVLALPSSVIDTRKDTLGLSSLLKMRQAVVCLRYAKALAQLARKRHADLIHCNSLKADVIGGVAAKMAKIPCIWHIRDHINDKYLPPRVATMFKALARRMPSGIIANSHSTLDQLGLSERGPKRAISYSGIPLEDFEAAAGAPMPPRDGGPVIVLVGRITSWKGQHVFIRAAAQIVKLWPDARFQIVGTPLFGEDAYERDLHAMVNDLGLTASVEFLGFRDDIPRVLANSTILVHASTIGEPFGRVVAEGMAAGRPIIATDGGALPEIVIRGPIDGPPAPGETGILIPMNDADSMARAIIALLADRPRALAMGQAGRRRVTEHFTVAATVRSIERVYEELLGMPAASLNSEDTLQEETQEQCV